MDLARLFADHIKHVQNIYDNALAELGKEANAPNIDAVLIHSGSEGIYFGDDRHIPFQPFGHFMHWLPVMRPDQMLLIQPGQQPLYFQVVRPDFWYEQTVPSDAWWADQFEIVKLTAPEAVMDQLPGTRRIAFLGENTDFAANMGLPANLHNEVNLTNYLDYHRGMKTDYEVEMVREANQRALVSHAAAKDAFDRFGSEWAIHQAYLAANQMIEDDCPYTNIIGLDNKAAILHYQNKRRDPGQNSNVLLIDAGYRHNNYCADITRTHARERTRDDFKALVNAVDQLQLRLVDQAKVGVPYADIHKAAHAGVLDTLLDMDLVKGDRDALEEAGISRLFFPHGIGHLLGIQVHDVGGYFKDETGSLAPPPEEHKFLRLNRKMEAGMIFTIEPGIYFIPVLLDPERNSDKSQYINWKLVDELLPLGGVRFEDNILVTADGPVNLTR